MHPRERSDWMIWAARACVGGGEGGWAKEERRTGGAQPTRAAHPRTCSTHVVPHLGGVTTSTSSARGLKSTPRILRAGGASGACARGRRQTHARSGSGGLSGWPTHLPSSVSNRLSAALKRATASVLLSVSSNGIAAAAAGWVPTRRSRRRERRREVVATLPRANYYAAGGAPSGHTESRAAQQLGRAGARRWRDLVAAASERAPPRRAPGAIDCRCETVRASECGITGKGSQN